MLDEYIIINKQKIAYREIDGQLIIVNLRASTFHTLDSVSTFIWENIDGKSTTEQIIQKIIQNFEIDYETAKIDCIDFIKELSEKEFVKISPNPMEEV